MPMIDVILRPESPEDFAIVENLTRDAFWNVNVPGCDEHYLAHTLRLAPAFIQPLDFVAVANGEIVGNIMYAEALIKDEQDQRHLVLTFGPVSVLPAFQGRGIGRRLIEHTLGIAKEIGYTAVVIYGDPVYYERLGFRGGESFGIRTRDGYFSPALQVLELCPGALEGIPGRFFEGEAYSLDPKAAELFEAGFPAKEKAVTPSQQRFMELLGQSHL